MPAAARNVVPAPSDRQWNAQISLTLLRAHVTRPRDTMRFYEYEAKALFARHGAPLLKGRVARTAAEARDAAKEIGGPVVLKSQVLTGGRMKAGGVKFAETPEQAEAAARDILALKIKGQEPRGVLVEQRAPVAKEYFAAVTWDGRRKLPSSSSATWAASTSRRSPRSIPSTSRDAPLDARAVHAVQRQGGDRGDAA
jgi:hypothetical protein